MSRLRSDHALEEIALYWRRKLGVEHQFVPDICAVLQLLPRYVEGFDIQVVSEGYLRGYEAYTDCPANKVFVGISTWNRLQSGEARARMTIAHEIAHIVLKHSGNRFRQAGDTVRRIVPEREAIEELEAKRFAGYFLAPSHLVTRFKSRSQICAALQISTEAAEMRLSQMQSTEKAGSRPRLPSKVVDFLEEKKKRGHKVESLLLLRDGERSNVPAVPILTSPDRLTGASANPPSRGFLTQPCAECENSTLFKDGTNYTCGTCGETGLR
jgi:Zn-dependent peptidase ImmA (M78 family)